MREVPQRVESAREVPESSGSTHEPREGTPRSRDDAGEVVLIVEDDADLRESLGYLLERKGFRVAAAANGREALDWIESHGPPRIILLDLMMPVMDGWELRRRLLSDPRYGEVPVVVISGVADAGDHAQALRAVDCLIKPIDPNRLYDILSRES